MSILQTLALSSSFAKIPLAGLGVATGAGLVTYLLIVPSDKNPQYIAKVEQLKTQIGSKEEELKNKEREEGAKYTQLLDTWKENNQYRKMQGCNKERIDAYKSGKSNRYASELLSGC